MAAKAGGRPRDWASDLSLRVDVDDFNVAPGSFDSASQSALRKVSTLGRCISPDFVSRGSEISSPSTEPRRPGPITFETIADLPGTYALEDHEEVDWGEKIRKQERIDLAAQDAAVAKAQKNGLSKAQIRKIKNRMSAIRSRKRKEIEQKATACRLGRAEKRAAELARTVLELRRENKRLRDERNGAYAQHQTLISRKRRRLGVQAPESACVKPLQRVSSTFETHPRTKLSCTEKTDERHSDKVFSSEMNAVASCSMEPGPAIGDASNSCASFLQRDRSPSFIVFSEQVQPCDAVLPDGEESSFYEWLHNTFPDLDSEPCSFEPPASNLPALL